MIWSQVYRYRSVSGPDQRRQTKWVVFGTALALSLLLALLAPLFLLVPGAAEASPFVLFLIGNVIPLIMLLIPLSVGTAMLRSGLFDIDLVIDRALVYAALTSSLILVYVGSVVSLQYGLRSVSGGSSQLAIVASTLVIAALFSPREVRRGEDARGLLRQAARRAGPGCLGRGPRGGGEGRGAAGARPPVVAPAGAGRGKVRRGARELRLGRFVTLSVTVGRRTGTRMSDKEAR
jgi:hypothetical protein